MNGGDELSLKDITFLRAIRDINGSPERYSSTESGVTPATVTAITEATTLSEDEVAYRLDHPRLGKSGLVKVYEAGLPGDDSAALNSAKLTEAGEAALADAEKRQASVDTEEWRSDENQSEFEDVQEWEPAEVETGGGSAAASVAAGEGGSSMSSGSGGAVTESPAVSEPATPPAATTRAESVGTESPAETGANGTVRVDEERLTALESRLDELEAEKAEPESGAETEAESAPAADPEQVAALHEEVQTLRETTEELEERLGTAVTTLDELDESAYGALDEKREKQFQTAVKSMVAFHQLASEVLDVRVENYEPAAGHPDPERIEISRNRIGDAVSVGQRTGSGGGTTFSTSEDAGWPSPDEQGGGRVFGGDDADEDVEGESGQSKQSDQSDGSDQPEQPEQESDAPDTGVYPPIGGSDDDSPREVTDAEDEPKEESDAPESGVYPPLGGNHGDESDDGVEEAAEADGSNDSDTTETETERSPGPADRGVDIGVEEAEAESIREAASEEGHVMEAIRTTGTESLPLSVESEALCSVREAVNAVREPAATTSDEAETLVPGFDVSGLPAVPSEAGKLLDMPLAEAAGGSDDGTDDDSA